MKGLNRKSVHVSRLMKEGRERMGLSLEKAMMLLGFSSVNYLWRCENGDENFPASKLKRAGQIYKLKPQQIIDAAIADYREAMNAFMEAS